MRNYHKYLTTSQIEENWGLYVTTAGYTKTSANQVYPISSAHPHSHQFTWNKGRVLDGYYLVFISKGRGVFESDNAKPLVVEEGNCFFLFPHVWHRYKPDEQVGWEEFWVGFNGPFAERLVQFDFFSPGRPLINVGLNEEILVLFQKLINTVKKGDPGYHQLISGYLLQLLSLVYHAAVFIDENTGDSTHYISKAKFLLQESIDRDLDLPQLAASLMVSYSKFRKDFKAVTHLSPHQYHLLLRLRKAAELLRLTHLSVSEISEQAGFESVFYFSRYFKKKVGVSPNAYRSASPKKLQALKKIIFKDY